MKRALRAPSQKGADRPALQCARTALNLHWIPAFAGMAEKRGGDGFYTVCFAGMRLVNKALMLSSMAILSGFKSFKSKPESPAIRERLSGVK